MPRIKIFACGNQSRGDDALGPLLIEPLEQAGYDCVQDFQLNIEHALDLQGTDMALFIDADVSTEPPYRFERLSAAEFPHYSTHALTPAAVLAVFEKLEGRPAPHAWVLGVRGEAFALGSDLSAAALRHAEAARALLQRLLLTPSPQYWDSQMTGHVHA